MVIFNINQMKPTLLLFFFLFALSSCEIDNYESPELTISGEILDAETNELVESGGINAGTIVKLYEGNSIQPLIYNTLPEGTFINSKVFPGNYLLEAEGPFTMVEEGLQNLVIDSDEEIEIKVIPHVRLTINIEEQSGVTAKIKLSYEKVLPEQKLLDLGIVWSEYRNPNIYSFPEGSILQEDVSTLDLTTGEKSFILENLKSNTTYYVRGSARTANTGNYYNYSTQLILQTQ